MNRYNSNITVSGIVNEALDVVSRNPMIVLIFLVPGLISLLGGLAISGSAGVLGEVTEVGLEDGSLNFDTYASFLGASALLSIVVSIVSILVSGIAIAMTADALGNRPVSIGAAFEFMKDKWILLIVVAIILAILQFIGVLACCIGYVIVVIATVFVKQGIVLDDMELTESFSRSFELARQVWPDVLVLFIIQIVASVVLGLIPFIGSFLGELVAGFFVVAFTIYYIGLTRAPPEPQPVAEDIL